MCIRDRPGPADSLGIRRRLVVARCRFLHMVLVDDQVLPAFALDVYKRQERAGRREVLRRRRGRENHRGRVGRCGEGVRGRHRVRRPAVRRLQGRRVAGPRGVPRLGLVEDGEDQGERRGRRPDGRPLQGRRRPRRRAGHEVRQGARQVRGSGRRLPRCVGLRLHARRHRVRHNQRVGVQGAGRRRVVRAWRDGGHRDHGVERGGGRLHLSLIHISAST